jgi:hypothetical protein
VRARGVFFGGRLLKGGGECRLFLPWHIKTKHYTSLSPLTNTHQNTPKPKHSIEHSQNQGFCELGVRWQNLENEGMRAALGLPKHVTGVYVSRTEPTAHAARVLRRGDVLTHFGGRPIADDGTFLFRESVRISFLHMASCAFDGDTVEVRFAVFWVCFWEGLGRALVD